MIRNWLATLVFALLLLDPDRASAQQPTTRGGTTTRVPVTVMLLDRLPAPGAPFVVVRRPDLTPSDLILLRSDASSEELTNAIHSLLVVRQAGGDLPASSAIMRMRAGQPRTSEVRQFPWVQRVLSDLRTAEVRQVEGIGRGRAVVIWLPPQGRGNRGAVPPGAPPPPR